MADAVTACDYQQVTGTAGSLTMRTARRVELREVAVNTGAVPQPLGDRLRQARERLGLTQDDVAARVGVSVSTISNWERGTSPKNRLALVLQVLGLDHDEDATAARPADVTDLPDGELWRVLRVVEAELERRFFARRPAGGPPERSDLKSGHHAPYPAHLFDQKPPVERRRTGE